MTPLLQQMGDFEVLGFISDASGPEDSSWKVDSVGWGYESGETNPEVILDGSGDNDNEVNPIGQEDMDVEGDAESIIGNLPMIMTPDMIVFDEMES